MNKEEWKAIPGYEGYYEVSDLGRVRSVDRTITRSDGQLRTQKGRILKEGTDSRKRLKVYLTKNGKQSTKATHSLVALAFIGERPKGYETCHIDGDYTNNKLSNIRYDTGSENQIDIYRYGKKHAIGKLTVEQVLEIRKLYATGKYKQVELAKKYEVHSTVISSIVLRKSFKWLNDDGTIQESKTQIKF